MFCKKCGTSLRDGAVFCSNCGTRITTEKTPQKKQFIIASEPSYTQNTQLTNSNTHKTATKNLLPFIILGIIIIILLGIIITLIFFKGDTSTPSTTQANAMVENTDAISTPEQSVEDSVITENQGTASQVTEPEIVLPELSDVPQYILPTSNSEYLTISDLEGLTAEECRIARNEIYARHGRLFTDEALQAYFNSCDWYIGTIAPEDFDESVLNEYEFANRDLIVTYEKESGYR